MFPIEKINVHSKLALFSDYFNPRIAGELNGQQVKLVKFQGEFVWHSHEKEDELFYVLRGEFQMHFRDQVIVLKENEFLIVPHGVEHKPVALDEVSVLLFEPAGTLNTGEVNNELTRVLLEKI